MPAAAMRMSPKAIRNATRRMKVQRMSMANIVMMMIAVITMMTTTMTSIAITIIIMAIPMLMTTSKAPPTEHRSGMKQGEAAALYRLMTWLSPAFPVGAFSYSSGIEWAGEAGDIVDAASLRDWLSLHLADGAGLRNTGELASAFVASRERQLETSTQGRAFIEIARTAWNCDGLDAMISCCDGAIVYPVAVGLVSAAHAIPLAPPMHAFLHRARS